jgi:TolB-like protein
VERRLAAIIAADVVGYSRLMGKDETGTLERLKSLRRELVQPKITERGGRIVKLMGDGLLAEFPSVVGAVQCAIDIQQEVAEREPDISDKQRIWLRIGINLGDIIVEGSDIYGDGVNVAARLEALADPGGICVSGTVFDSVKGKVGLEFADLGKQRVKNIDQPVQVYRVVLEGLADGSGDSGKSSGGAGPLEQPDKLSIAVLPFTNMTGDREQEYFSDGMTEDIITELSRFAVLNVVARHSSFAFKGEKLNIKEVARKLDVQYVVEGSVRRAGNRVRITAQLIEAETGTHIWAERYDRELEDIFAVQDEVTRSIVGVLPGRVQESVAERASRKRTDDMKAYELLLHGKSVRDSFSAEDTARARPLFEKAIELDPGYAKAHAYLADTYFMDLCFGVATADASRMSLHHARKAMALDSSDVANHDQLGFAYIGAGMWKDAEAQFDKAVLKVVTEAEPMTWIGYGLLMLGRSEEARDMVVEAKRLDPLHPPSFDWVLGQACYFAKRYEEAVRVLAGEALLNSFAYACLVGANAHLGQVSEARVALEIFVRIRRQEFNTRSIIVPENTISALAGGYRKVWRKEEDWDHIADGLRKAGLPD